MRTASATGFRNAQFRHAPFRCSKLPFDTGNPVVGRSRCCGATDTYVKRYEERLFVPQRRQETFSFRFRERNERGVSVRVSQGGQVSGLQLGHRTVGMGFGVALPMPHRPLGYPFIRPIEHFWATYAVKGERGGFWLSTTVVDKCATLNRLCGVILRHE